MTCCLSADSSFRLFVVYLAVFPDDRTVLLLDFQALRISFIVGLGLCAMLFIFVYFKQFERDWQIAIFVLASLIASLGSMIEYRCDRKKLDAMKEGLEELKEFEEDGLE